MITKITKWKLSSGNQVGQETMEQKRQLGNDYIARLRSDGENIISVVEDGEYLIITMEEK